MKRWMMSVLIALIAVGLLVNSTRADDIKIGAVFPFTGQAALYAEDAKRALELAQDEVNMEGGIRGKKVKFIYEDDAGTPKGGVSAVQKLIEIDKVDAIVGSIFSSVVMAMKPIVTAHKVVLLAPMASHPDIYSGTKYIISLTPTDNDNTYVNAKYCTQVLKKKTLAILYMLNDTGIASGGFMVKWWEHFGGKVLVQESYTPGSTDFRTQLTKIREANPDVTFMCVTWREAVNILKQFSEMNLKCHVTANSQVREPKLLELVGRVAEGMNCTTEYIGGTEDDRKLRDKFEKEITARYKQPPQIVAYNTYDCTRALFEALRRGATKGESLRNTIVSLDIPGVYGHIRFREDGSPKGDTAMWVVKDGKFVELNYVDCAP